MFRPGSGSSFIATSLIAFPMEECLRKVQQGFCNDQNILAIVIFETECDINKGWDFGISRFRYARAENRGNHSYTYTIDMRPR